MSKKRKLQISLMVMIGMLFLIVFVLYSVFDIGGWQQLDPSKLHELAQTSSLYDSQGNLMSVVRGNENIGQS